MNRPLLPPALAFAGGILLNECLRLHPGYWLAAATVALVVACNRRPAHTAGLWMGWISAGALAHGIHDTPIAPHDLRRLADSRPRIVDLRGVLAETPSLRLGERRGQWTGRTMVRFEVTAWRPPGNDWTPATGAVMAATRGAFPATLFRGSRVEVSGVLQRPAGPAAAGLFNYREHLRHAGIFHTLEVARVEDWQAITPPDQSPPWSERFLPWAQKALARGLPDDEATRLLWAMTLGWRTALSGEVDTVFMESGTIHVFAISGLHIALIAGALVAVLRAIRIPRNACGILAIPLVWFYVAATGWQSSAVRSAVMMSAVAGTWVINRPGDLVNSLALSALAILSFEPGQLLQAGFQLSFGVVMGLALLVPVLEPQFLRVLRFNADPFLPDPLRPPWKRALDAPIRWLATSLATGAAAWLSSLPFVVHTFHLFTPISMLANLAVVPLSGLALAANLTSLMVTPLWPELAAVFNASAWVWMKAMIAVSRTFAQIPGGAWYVPSPSWPWWWVYEAALLGFSSGHLQTPGGLRRCRPIAAVLMAVAALQVGHSLRTTTLTILPGGESMIVDGPGRGYDLVVNTGGTSTGPGVVTPFLHAHGWNRVPVLAIGHADTKCLGGAPDFLRLFQPGLTLKPAGERLRSPAFQAVVRTAGELALPVQSVSRGDVIAGWTVLNPVALPAPRTADDASLVLARRIRGVRVLMLSQLSRQGQRALLDREADGERLRADLVISGLPRDREALIPDLLEATRPRLIILASARSPSAREVPKELRERLASTGVPVHFTGESGALTVVVNPRRIDVCASDGTVLGSLPHE